MSLVRGRCCAVSFQNHKLEFHNCEASIYSIFLAECPISEYSHIMDSNQLHNVTFIQSGRER